MRTSFLSWRNVAVSHRCSGMSWRCNVASIYRLTIFWSHHSLQTIWSRDFFSWCWTYECLCAELAGSSSWTFIRHSRLWVVNPEFFDVQSSTSSTTFGQRELDISNTFIFLLAHWQLLKYSKEAGGTVISSIIAFWTLSKTFSLYRRFYLYTYKAPLGP